MVILRSPLLLLTSFFALSFGSSSFAQDTSLLKFFAPLPETMDRDGTPSTPEQIALGKKLFFDQRLSKDGTVSCNSCHGLDTYGVDGLPVSEGIGKQKGPRNAPTVYNAAGHFVQFWDGRAADVEEQAKGPILNPIEMGMESIDDVLAVLSSDPEYPKLFAAAFPDEAQPLSWDNLANAIGAFERQLVTPSRWDKYLQGEEDALTPLEKKGFQAFTDNACFGCHSGPYLGGQMYMKLGLVKPWPNQEDQGRFALTKAEGDKMVFKVPGLRNVAQTGPYFHDGSEDSLEEAVRLMALHQSGRTLSPEDTKAIVAFLGSLTGELPKSPK